jgi:hypothetical protein
VKYENGFYIPEDGILHSYRRETLKSYILAQGFTSQRPQLPCTNLGPTERDFLDSGPDLQLMDFLTSVLDCSAQLVLYV